MLTLLTLSLTAVAGDCDAQALVDEIAEASPQRSATIFTELGACDAALAVEHAPTLMPRVLSGSTGNEALITAITVGANTEAVAWLETLQSDERAGAISALGEACNASGPVQEFFVERAGTLGDDFWSQRWYGSLSACHVTEIQALLWAELSRCMDSDRSRFFSVLEAYARSAQTVAVPALSELLGKSDDAEVQANIIGAFADAAQVGSVDGTDFKTAEASNRAIVAAAPNLTEKAVEQARITLTTLGDEQAADSLSAVRYKDLLQADGTLLYGTVVVENATCKNGKVAQRVHPAAVVDPGQTWPDQLKEKIEVSVNVAWELDLASGCRGEGETTVLVPSAPFADRAALAAWQEEKIRGAKRDDVKKTVKREEPDLPL